MAMVPLATQGNFIHVYDFRVKPGSGERFINWVRLGLPLQGV